MNTKKNILITALRLFAVDGYEAVSVSQIAGELGMTKGALYKHYKNKRAIFDSIFAYVCQLDVERSRQTGVPEHDFSETSEAFANVSPESLKAYMATQFSYWSEDEIARNFRRMLTLEQYRSDEMRDLYQKVLTSGPLEYIENLLREMLGVQEEIQTTECQEAPKAPKDNTQATDTGIETRREAEKDINNRDPKQMAIEFYAPFYLLLSVCDTTPEKLEWEKLAQRYRKHMDDFFEKYSL